jgi:hypothetical protein
MRKKFQDRPEIVVHMNLLSEWEGINYGVDYSTSFDIMEGNRMHM